MRSTFCLFLILSAFFIPFAPGQSFGATKVVFVNDPWPPYVLGESSEFQVSSGGIAVRLIKEIYSHIDNMEADVYLVPWKRALLGLKTGTYDGIPILFKTPERIKYIDYSAPVFMARTVLFYRKADFPDGIKWESYNDLKEHVIAVQKSFKINETFKEQIKKGIPLKIFESDTDERSFFLLKHKRVDLVATNEIVGKEYLRRQSLQEEILPSKQAIYEKPFHIAFSRKTEAKNLIPEINKIIYSLKQNGTIQRIVNNP